ncbi:MAG: GNAT superfamily N-acetyltransferase [Planctomycetota bacterium]|jgi:GNAT superfamily N-acetyltransferase
MNQTITRDLESQAIRLMETVLRDGKFLTGEQPLAFDPQFDGRRHYITREGKVVSALTTLVRELHVGDMRINVGLIGSVVTDPAFRGQGLATELLTMAESELKKEGAAIALLWADEREFYGERGYVPVGTELDYRVPKNLLSALPHTGRVRPAEARDDAAIHALYGSNQERVQRSTEETRALLRGPGIATLVHEEGGIVDAYAIEGRGRDLTGMVHEWGGQRVRVLACLAGHLERLNEDEEALWWMVPPSAVDMQAFMNGEGVEGLLGVLAMGKLLDPCALGAWLSAVTPASVRVIVEEGGLRVFGPQGDIFLDPTHALFTVVPPQTNREVITVVEQAIGLALPNLPQNPFLWGLDSI